MDKNKLIEIINKLQTNIDQLKVLAGVGIDPVRVHKRKVSNKKSKRQKTDLETPIRELLNSDFFSGWKTDNDVIKKLRIQVLTPKRASVSNVLRRLTSPKRGLLERQGDGTKRNPWKYKKKKFQP